MRYLNSNIPTRLTFYYMGVNQAGKKVTGYIDAPNQILAKIELRKNGILIKKIIKKRFIIKNPKITSHDITLFSRQLATMIESGIPLIQALDILGKGQSKPKVKQLIVTIKNDIESGLNLSEALLKHHLHFNELFCNLIAAGEKSGTLDLILIKIAAYKEKIESIKKKIKKALIYPIAVLVIALVITSCLLIFVVPQFESLFKDFGAELPLLTQGIIHLSWFLQSYSCLTAFVISGSIFCGFQMKKRVPPLKQFNDRILLKTPLTGIIIEKAIIARFARTLSITFAAGLPLIEALKSAGGTTGNIIFTQAIEGIKNEVSSGQLISKAIENTHLFPPLVTQMIAVGEESGALEKMLLKIADFYEEDVDNSVDSLTSLLEPIIMSLLGILVGGLVIAMYLPIFKLGSAI